jgi:hypothetical protein
MIFAKNDPGNDSAAFSNIGYSVARYRRRNRLERWIRNWRGSHVKPAPIPLARLIWLVCLFCFGVFMILAGLTLCSNAVAKRVGQVNEYSITSTLGANDDWKGDIGLK